MANNTKAYQHALARLLSMTLLAILLSAGSTKGQAETATISGTATDASGAALVGAKVEARNIGTNITQATQSDAQGRYRIANLPVGEYEVRASMSGFQTMVHTGITLTVGASLVVDVSLTVGQVTQTVNVESEISRVETQTASVSSLVSPSQMSNLPLNGRNFEQLFTLAPGVQSVPQTVAGGGTSATFYGSAANFSVSGSRPEGQAFLLDNQEMVNFWGHAAGSSVTGNSLGVDAIQEFQLLTNTYSSQFGGAGAAMNAVSKSGANGFHGSGYEFLRNSALDARNFFDGPKIPAFRRNQFGGELGGPVKKEKAFFFVNYEGLRSTLGQTGTEYIPDVDVVGLGSLPGEVPWVTGMIPCNTLHSAPVAGCDAASHPRVPVHICQGPTDLCGLPGAPAVLGRPDMVPFAQIFYNQITTPAEIAAVAATPHQQVTSGPWGSISPDSGNVPFRSVASQIVSENYVLGRMDYTVGAKDSLFGRYISNTARQVVPFALSLLPYWPEVTHSGDQFFALEEKHLISATAINEVRFGYSRTNERLLADADQHFLPSSPMQFYPGAGRPDGSINIAGGTSPLGTERYPKAFFKENKISFGDEIFWTRGAHSLKVGAAVARVQSNVSAGAVGGPFNFNSLPLFLVGTQGLFLGVQNPSPVFTTNRYFRQTDIFPYIQDDWKVRRNLTLNVGLRYAFATNATCTGGVPCYTIPSPLSTPTCSAWQTPYNIVDPPCGFVKTKHVLAGNPNAMNFDPRIGLAWDAFSDHKTSVRAGFGIFHEPVVARTFDFSFLQAPPSGSIIAVGVNFPLPATTVVSPAFSYSAGLYYGTSTAPYYMQYNLTIQRDVGHGSVASVGYVGGQGVHLFSLANSNTPAVVGGPSNCTAVPCRFVGKVANPGFGGLNIGYGTAHSTYNGLQASFNRQISHDLAWQVSYTYSRTIDDGSVSYGFEQGSYMNTDIYNQRYDRGPSTFNITHTLRVNAIYGLPFKQNRLVSGWQVAPILSADSGLPFNLIDALNPLQANLGGIQGDRPDYSNAPGCTPNHLLKQKHPGYVQWFDAGCYTLQPYGALGHVGRDSIPGPGHLTLDFSILKDTKITEKLTVQFRAEFFNIINHTNFGPPTSQFLYAGTRGLSAWDVANGVNLTLPPYNLAANPAPANVFTSATAGQILTTGQFTSRQIQFALKLMF